MYHLILNIKRLTRMEYQVNQMKSIYLNFFQTKMEINFNRFTSYLYFK